MTLRVQKDVLQFDIAIDYPELRARITNVRCLDLKADRIQLAGEARYETKIDNEKIAVNGTRRPPLSKRPIIISEHAARSR